MYSTGTLQGLAAPLVDRGKSSEQFQEGGFAECGGLSSMSGQKSSLMPLKSLIREFQEMKGGIGSISRRSFEIKHHLKGRSSCVVLDETQLRAEPQEQQQQSCWANMPPELLRDVIQRIEASESVWPIRKHVVACAAVCSTWREITKELVDTPERSGKLTFPISLKQVRIYSDSSSLANANELANGCPDVPESCFFGTSTWAYLLLHFSYITVVDPLIKSDGYCPVHYHGSVLQLIGAILHLLD